MDDAAPDPAPVPGLVAEARSILRLAAPIAIAQAGQVTLGLVDTFIVGHVGDKALAAVGAGHGVVQLVALFGMGAAMGLDPVVSQRVGAGEAANARRALGDGILLSCLAAPILVLLLTVLERVVLAPNMEGSTIPILLPMHRDVAEMASAYVWWRAPGVLPFMLFAAFRSWFLAHHLTRPLLWATLWANVANAVLDYVFVFGDDGLEKLGLPRVGLPAYGAAGAAAVTTIVSFLMVGCLAPAARREIRRQNAAAAAAAPARPPESRARGMARILRYGLPTGGVIVLEVGIFVLVALKMGVFGPAVQAAHQIAINLASFTFMVTVGIGAAAAVRVGRSIGAGRTPAARRSGLTAIALSATWMGLCGLVFMLFPAALARAFTHDPDVIAAAIPLLRIAALFQIFDGIQSAALGALRGAGDTRVPFLANLFAYWFVGLPVAHYLAASAGLGPAGLWYGLTIALVVVSILVLWRFARLTRVHVERVA